ncbi:bifunctional folylpolyglutamate synthase/dihydrofolate synthase [Philodulcilactobacillus myokoensis]|uniref:Dihydrofolate synthase/folylpolyglutamate synthase n=1 Tax=Philodulcilactobacillus myokoensis TaxID=2929573 RepID=A0A9W6B0T2_9LACO|nr:bifunctional folylpolyglutamate synthase/dihydrofolate synthase [Philodulcilactobacillus myokoensis]
MDNYNEALNFISSRGKFKKSPTLNRMKLFLKMLGNPQNHIKAIHIAGTNGKGSTLTFLRNMLEAQGLTVGTFTSPYLIKFNERISVDGKPVSDNEILNLAQTVEPIVKELDRSLKEGGPTEFEVDTAMMFKYFAKHQVDIVLVEVGIGGLYDSTNVFTPECSVITTIGYDHMKLLGNTLPKIAFQKAGIIKTDIPVVVGKINLAPLNVIKKVAKQHHSKIIIRGFDYKVQPKHSSDWQERFSFISKSLKLDSAKINMLGQFQIDNAATAIAAFIQFLKINHYHIEPNVILKGLKNTFWAGRFERINNSPLIVIDGAHNVPAINELDILFKKRFNKREIYIILAILADKQFQLMIKNLLKIKNVHLILTEFNGPGKRPVANLDQLYEHSNHKSRIDYVSNWHRAFAETITKISDDDLLLFTGSLYFISDVRKFFN